MAHKDNLKKKKTNKIILKIKIVYVNILFLFSTIKPYNSVKRQEELTSIAKMISIPSFQFVNRIKLIQKGTQHILPI